VFKRKEHFQYEWLADAADKAKDILAKPNLIIGLSRGGLVPAVYFSHAFGDVPVISYDPKKDGGLLYPVRWADADRVLVVDEICDSGGTLERLHEALPYWFATYTMIDYAVLVDKGRGTVRPKYTYIDTKLQGVPDDAWWVFPWESK
jgi:hypoxanthine phosphoribosyltransferase